MKPRVLIIGYGSQGRAQALNLRDSGWNVRVYLRDGSGRLETLEEDGIQRAKDIAASIAEADFICMLIPDGAQPAFYNEHLKGAIPKGKSLAFAHGYSIYYEEIVPDGGVDVLLAAPAAHADTVRSDYKKGFACYAAVHQDASGRAWQRVFEFSKAIGSNPIIRTTFKEETETDLFIEQASLCGGIPAIIRTSFETLVDAGYSKEMAYHSCLKEILPIVRAIDKHGLNDFYKNISDTAAYGGWTRGEKIAEQLRPMFDKILMDVESGSFKRERDSAKQKIPPDEFSSHEINAIHDTIKKGGPDD